MTGHTSPDPTHAWMEVVALLTEAADQGFTLASQDRGVHSVAVGAQIVASSALALLPEDLDVDAIDLDEATDTMSVGDLIRAAEHATRRHPIEAYPSGASGVIVALCDLVHEAAT